MFFQTKKLKKRIEDLTRELEYEKDKVEQRDKFIDLVQKNNRELSKSFKNENDMRKHYEGRTVIAETKLSRIHNAIKSYKDDDQKAYEKIKEIMYVDKAKHGK